MPPNPEIIWITNGEGRVEFINQRWQDYCGVPFTATTAEEVATAFIHPDDAPHLMAAFMHSLQTGEHMEVEQRNRSASGEYRWVLNRASPYRNPKTGKVQNGLVLVSIFTSANWRSSACGRRELLSYDGRRFSHVWVWMTDEKLNVRYANKVKLTYLVLFH